MESALVTGAHGFIGRNLCQELESRGVAVYRVGRNDSVYEVKDKVTHIYHCADVQGDTQWSSEHCGEQFMANLQLTSQILHYWKFAQRQARFVGFSSLWAYPDKVVNCDESTYWNGPMFLGTEHYGIIKKTLGVGIQALARQYKMGGTMLVLGNVFGPGDTSNRIIPSLIRRMRDNPDKLEVYNPDDSRNFIFIKDQIDRIIAMRNDTGPLLNIGGLHNFTVRTVVSILVELMQYKGEIVWQGPPIISPGRRMNSSFFQRMPEADFVYSTSLFEALRLTIAGTE